MFSRDGEGFTYIDIFDKGSLKRPNPTPYNKYAASVVKQFRGMLDFYINFFLDYRVLRCMKLLRAFDPYGNLDNLQQFCLKRALDGNCELDYVLSLVQVCAVLLTPKFAYI
jgi:hypothetical protein